MWIKEEKNEQAEEIYTFESRAVAVRQTTFARCDLTYVPIFIDCYSAEKIKWKFRVSQMYNYIACTVDTHIFSRIQLEFLFLFLCTDDSTVNFT